MNTDESLFREVDEDVRKDQLARLWKRYGNYAVAVSIGIIIAVAAIKGWQYWQERRAEAAATDYVAAMKLEGADKTADALTALGKIASGSQTGFAVLARFETANLLARDGKKDEAAAAYDAIAADSAVDQGLRDTARVRAALLLADTASVADLDKRLDGLDAAGNPWRNLAREIRGLAALKAGDITTADKLMNEILADEEATPAARQRAGVVEAILKTRLGSKAE